MQDQGECIEQTSSVLLTHSRSFRPVLLRDQLTRSIELFPSNTIFLSLFAWNESRLRIDDRVRTILLSTVLTETSDNLPARVFAIRHSIVTENVHSTRAAFENAVESMACAHSWGIWQLYTAWCMRTKEFRHRAKEVFYRGLRAAPWAKQLAMFAFTHLREVMTFEELKNVYRVLGEKELRVHIDIEDQLEEIEDDVRMKSITQ